MAKNSKIEWTDHTFNPWIGCTKVSQGCKNCYAELLMGKRYKKAEWGPQGQRIRTSAANWKKPLAWNRQAAQEGRRYKVFCASLADIFEWNDQLINWRRELMTLIEQTPHLDWLLLTKRPENIPHMVPWMWYQEDAGGYLVDGGQWPANVWIGTSVENQQTADERIPLLMSIPARYRFLSMEPLLGPVDFWAVPGFNCYNLNLHGWWVIVGGESGPNARPMHPDWARSLRDQCHNAGVPFFFKQWGEWGPCRDYDGGWPCIAEKVGKAKAGRLLDGVEHNAMPKIEEMP